MSGGDPGVTIVFETHAITEDNENDIASGWLPGRLSPAGRDQARLLGERRRDDGLAVIFVSDLARAVETVGIAFDGSDIPVLHDWRLRECNYGSMNGSPVGDLRRGEHLDRPYPSGESWRQAVTRVCSFLGDLDPWTGERVLVVGHTATRWALDHRANNIPIEELVTSPFAWRAGWEYRVSPTGTETADT
jgi:broad specificity phosphatase PhoE